MQEPSEDQHAANGNVNNHGVPCSPHAQIHPLQHYIGKGNADCFPA
jgi:hypothetical protein